MVMALADATRRALAVGLIAGALWCAAPMITAMAQEAAPPASTTVGPWFVRIKPYAWVPSVGGSTRATRRIPSRSIDKSFSDLTWQMLGAVEYTFSNSVSGAIGYHYLGYDFGGHAPLDDMALYGPTAGVTVRF